MKTSHRNWPRTAVKAVLLPLSTTAGLAADPGPNPNRFSASARFLFNVSADFHHLPSAADPGPGPGIHTANHLYDNGYVQVDESGNAGNLTWNWGYQDQTSIQGTTLQLRSVRSPADGLTQESSSDPQSGFEASYGRVLAQIRWSDTRALRIGLQGSFGLTLLDIDHRSEVGGATTGVQDDYDLSALPIIPNAPFLGTGPIPGGPLPVLIPDAPFNRTAISLPATASEQMRVQAELYGFKLGPFCEIPLTDTIELQFQGGFAALLADAEFSYRETISTGGASQGLASDSRWCLGAFVEGHIAVRLGKAWSAHLGGGWQHLDDFSLRASFKAVDVKLDQTATAFGGFAYSF